MDTPPTPFEALKEFATATDPAARARTAGNALKAVPELQKWLRRVRQDAVLELRGSGYSHADVAKEIGTSRARAQQIAEGRTTGKRADPKPGPAESDSH
jgi:hypothetical protein